MGSRKSHIANLSKSVFDGLFGDTAPKQINWALARFADRSAEENYQQHLVDVELPKDRLVNYLGITIYMIFGFLDLMTFKENLNEVLILRWVVCAPIAILLITLTFSESVKRHFQLVTIAVMAIGSGSMVAMIGLMGPEGGPPYIVGVLSIFIFFSCIQRMHYPIAAAVYLAIVASYSGTIVFVSPKSSEEIVSGHFFMIFIASIALFTTYMQEIRSRLDYSQRRQRELDAVYIQELLIEATAADRAKISFLSILSHEMRTPLHQIVGFSEVVRNLLQQATISDSPKYLDEIHSSATGLLSTIGKILRYADATAGKVSYEIDACSIEYLVETVCEQALTKAEAKKILLNVDDLVPATLHIDHPHTCYALGHIIENAINASETGATVEVNGVADDDGGYILAIKDHGCGMTDTQLNDAMTPFTQTESHKTRNRVGVGIGLTLAQKILADQKAALTIESMPGKGTTAYVRFDLRSQKASESKPNSHTEISAQVCQEQENG